MRDVKLVVEIPKSNWTNPFGNDATDLINLSTAAVAPPNICTDLLGAQQNSKNAHSLHVKKLEKAVIIVILTTVCRVTRIFNCNFGHFKNLFNHQFSIGNFLIRFNIFNFW